MAIVCLLQIRSFEAPVRLSCEFVAAISWGLGVNSNTIDIIDGANARWLP